MAAPSSGVVRTAPRSTRAPRPSTTSAASAKADAEGLEHLVEWADQWLHLITGPSSPTVTHSMAALISENPKMAAIVSLRLAMAALISLSSERPMMVAVICQP